MTTIHHSSPTTATLEFRPLTVPASIDAPDAHDFQTMTEVRNRTYRAVSGNDDEHQPPESLLPHYHPNS